MVAPRWLSRENCLRSLFFIGITSFLTVHWIFGASSFWIVCASRSQCAGTTNLSRKFGSRASVSVLGTMPSFPSRRVVIIGSGLAGLTAGIEIAHVAEEQHMPIDVVILEKEPQPGGNSMRASSGMNSLNRPAHDNETCFQTDTLVSGGGLSDSALVSALVEDSEEARLFLSKLGANLTKVSKLGGHSVPRSWSNPTGPNVGALLIKSALATIKDLPSVRILNKTKVERLVLCEGRVTGVVVEQGDGCQGELSADAVILATGGFAANKTLLTEYNPEAASFATTNGPWATGDGIHLGAAIGAQLIHMNQVQVHPTGFVDPHNPTAPSKVLAPERLRGVGAVLLNTVGRRFVNELERRDIVTEAMKQQAGQQALILLGQDMAVEYGLPSLEFYRSRGLMTRVDNVEEAARSMAVPVEVLSHELNQYNEACDEGTDRFGKSTFPSKISLTDTMWLGTVTPVVHYTMGGVAINSAAQVLAEDTQVPIPGLFAAGEVSGGLHGRNRLAGNSLLECVVFGRIAGREALRRMQQTVPAL